MAIKLNDKLAPVIGYVQVKNRDGSLMADENGVGAYARMHSPASKTWEAANAALRRKSLKRVRENGGKIEAVADEPVEETIEFLCAITEEFINLEVDLPEGETGTKAMVRAIYTNPQLGYIRDQMKADNGDWGALLGKLPTPAISGPGNSPG